MSRFLYSLVLLLFASLYSAFAAPFPLKKDASVNLVARGNVYTGSGTYYNVGLGNCGQQNVDSDPIVAISKKMYDQNNGRYCNQWVQVTYNGKSVYAMVRDSCPGCAYNDLDMSLATFQSLADKSKGRINISWKFMDKSWKP